MALPPTAFKDLLRGSHEEMYDALRAKRCLSWRGRRERDAVLEVMRESASRYRARVEGNPHAPPGPNAQDRLAQALLASPFVNWRARWLSFKDTR